MGARLMSTAEAELNRPVGGAVDIIRYSVFFPAALAFFQRALAAAAIFALAAALILRLAFLTGFSAVFCPLTFAHRAREAAAILALPAALILRFFFGATVVLDFVEVTKIRPSSFSSDWILSFMLAARRNCRADRFAMDELMAGN